MKNGKNSSLQFEKMTKTPVPKLVLSLAVPTIIAMLITVIYNTCDTYFVSQINKSASAAVGAVFALMSIIQAIGFGVGMGSASLISIKLGEKKVDEASQIASSGTVAAFLFGAVVGVFGLIFLEPMLKVLGCSETMMPYAKPYATFILISAPISTSTFVLNNTLRAEGHSKLAMWGMGIGGILNVILDPIFIFTLNMGTGGAALATAISQTLSFLILISLFVFEKSIVKINLKNVSKKLSVYGKIISTGLPTICRQGLGSVATAILNVQAVVYGDAMVASISIANKVYMLARNIVIGLGQGFQPVAGYNFGSKKPTRAFKAFSFSTIVGSIFCVVVSVIIAIFRTEVMTLFSKDLEVVSLGQQMLLFYSFVIPFLAFSTYVNQFMQGLGFKTHATILASCRQGIFFIPLIFILPIFLKDVGVQITQPIADFLTFIVSIPFIVWFYRSQFKGREDIELSDNNSEEIA